DGPRDFRIYAPSQLNDYRVAHDNVAELLFANRTARDRGRHGMIHAELPFQPRLRHLLAREFEDQRVNLQVDPLASLGREPVLLAELQTPIDRRMDHHATRKWLVAVHGDFIAAAQVLRNLGVLARRT